MIEAGQVLQGRYRVEKQIGQGGMGAVFIATDERFGSTVAIKETFFTDEQLRKAFEREARLLNSLRHPALPRVSDHFIEGNGQFIVMEFIDGEDLSEQLENDGATFPVESILGWADQLLDALEYLHTREIPVIHRDIKPQNLKLTPDGRIILLDFGLAKGNPTTPESATAAKSVFGYSRNYASIEQIQGSGTDPRSDLYALSATLYHLLTGVPPADALTRAMSVLSSKPDPLVEPAAIRKEIPYGVSRVLVESMALSAEDRPSSAASMREKLADGRHLTTPLNVGTVAEIGAGTAIYAQETKIQSTSIDAPTQTFPNQESTVTQIKPLVDAAAASETPAAARPRRGGLIKLAVGGLLLAGTAVGSVMMFSPLTSETVTTPNSNSAPKALMTDAPANSSPQPANSSNTSTAAVNSNSVAPVDTLTSDPKPREDAAKSDPKQVDPKTATTSVAKPKTNSDEQPDVDLSDIMDDDDVPKGPPPTGGPPPKGGTPPQTPPTRGKILPPFVWEQMSPKERREFKQALEIERRRRMEEQRRRSQQPKPPANTP